MQSGTSEKASKRITTLFHDMLNALMGSKQYEESFNEFRMEKDNSQQGYRFTLPQLCESFSQLDSELATLSYTEFRKVLFNSPINEEMKKRGGEILILNNKGKVDESVYCLKITL